MHFPTAYAMIIKSVKKNLPPRRLDGYEAPSAGQTVFAVHRVPFGTLGSVPRSGKLLREERVNILTKYIVEGGKPLFGEVEISGAKNAAVAIIPAA